jgi:hypothetical protein
MLTWDRSKLAAFQNTRAHPPFPDDRPALFR